jgi:hypothetical protein
MNINFILNLLVMLLLTILANAGELCPDFPDSLVIYTTDIRDKCAVSENCCVWWGTI